MSEEASVTRAEAVKMSWAQLVSDIFSPIMMPTYGMVVAMWCTNMNVVPTSHRVLATVLVWFLTGLIPFVTIAILIKMGKVHTRSIENRNERFVPMSVAAVCYLATSLFIRSLGAPSWIYMFFAGAAVAVGVAMAVTTRWKISAHTTSAGGFVGLASWLVVNTLADVNAMIVLSVAIIIAGAVSSSRLMLSRHTPAQAAAGLALGFAATMGLMYL